MNEKKETAAAVKLRQKRAVCWGNLLFDALILYLLPKELLMETLARLQRMGLERGLRFMWETNREPLFGLAIFTVLALSLLISLLSIFSLNSRIARLPDNVPVNSPARPREAQTAKGSGAMNRKQKQPMSKNSAIVMVGVVAAIMISAMAEDPDAIIPAVVTIVVVASIAAAVVASNKTKAGKSGKKTDVELHRPFPQPTAMKTKQPSRILQHADEVEEAITCAHRSGKQKYLEQIEGFYKNGLIDREEYKTLRAKYEMLDLPDDYH